MIDVNAYLARQYPAPPCWCLVADVYTTELGQPVDAFQTVNNSIRSIASAFRLSIHKNPNGFRQIPEPVEHCVVLLGKTDKLGLHHCGVFVEGRLLHALDSGVYYEELSSVAGQYALVEYWAKA
jgi:hypothetical protein